MGKSVTKLEPSEAACEAACRTEKAYSGTSGLGLLLILCCVGCEIGKQISNYSTNYHNGGRYPLPQTVLVRQL